MPSQEVGSPRDSAIEYLVNRHFAKEVASISSSEDEQKASYRAVLAALPEDDLRALFELRAVHDALDDELQLVNRLGPRLLGQQPERVHPRFKEWAQREYWSSEEATALSLGLEPDRLRPLLNAADEAARRRKFDGARECSRILKTRQDIVDRKYPPRGFGPGTVVPIVFVRWAKAIELNLPLALEAAVEGEQASYAAQDPPASGEEEKPLNHKTLRHYQILCLGLTIHAFKGFDPFAARSPFTEQIISVVQEAGLPKLDNDTLLKRYRESADKQLPPDHPLKKTRPKQPTKLFAHGTKGGKRR
jgi:hypothetical protein